MNKRTHKGEKGLDEWAWRYLLCRECCLLSRWMYEHTYEYMCCVCGGGEINWKSGQKFEKVIKSEFVVNVSISRNGGG